MIMRRLAVIIPVIILIVSCTPPPRIGKNTMEGFRLISDMRDEQFRSAAFLVDLRVNDNGRSYSVTTELYFSGDSVGFYGRGYLGKGAFRGQIIDDIATIYFNGQNEFFTGPLANIGHGADCASPGEVLLLVMSLLTGKGGRENPEHFTYPSKKEIRYFTGRFEKTVMLDKQGYPKSEKLIDPACRDSIVIQYYSPGRQFPFYKVQNALYYNGEVNFRARGFIREQKYNIDIGPKKFAVDIPASAVRLDSI